MDYIRISVADNGYILAYDDPEIREQNRKSDSSWQDPERQRVYATPEALVEDLKGLVPGLKKKDTSVEDDFAGALNEAFTKGSMSDD